ncbi:hypothetical protein GGR60_000849 [Xanthomonas arboricola]|uniref:hypothetical protein n=1 Tax=Xanthomonas euroxanthea TaxID=2259622 RepID=UPI0014303455|nr:hypothetical protein [Xanthomonas euroxanthea]NJC36359.1 hypothetical protein [Xanthomonas euroxanthea]
MTAESNSGDPGRMEGAERSVYSQVIKVADKILRDAEASGQVGGASTRQQEAFDRLREEERSYRGEQRAEEIKALQAQNDRVRHDMELRRKYASRAVVLAYIGVIFWCAMFLFTGGAAFFDKKFLSDAALITLTSGATVNVIAVFLVVVRGLFPPEAKLSGKIGNTSSAAQGDHTQQ